MSHTTAIKGIQITSEAAVQRAVAFLQSKGSDIELVRNTKPRAYYNNQAGMTDKAELCIKVNGSKYDIGLYKQANGTYEPRFDAWANDIAKVLGSKDQKSGVTNDHEHHIGAFLQEYSIAAASIQSESEGRFVERVETKSGDVKLMVRGY